MSQKTIGLALIVIGILILAVSLLADVIGIGQYKAEIGFRQMGGAAFGLILAIVGVVLALRKPKTEE